mmetsp:Transcript_6713/g.8013  ORF Transcript_6713/g.8013 Transcript_6713/m.8013 type:complete len:98 (+) Transcript_6713:200-493(+)
MGVSFSTMVTIGCNMLFVVIYAWKFSDYKIMPIPSKICGSLLNKSDVGVYLSISVPSIVMLMAEWIGVELLIVLAAFVSVEAVGAMSISYSYHNLIY